MKIVNVNVKLIFPDDYTDEQICDIITDCDYEFNYPTNGGVNEVRPIDSEITNWEIGAESEAKEQKPVHNEYYVLVQFPEDTGYFEENEIGYPSFESEDNGGRFVSKDDYIRIFGKEPDPKKLYKPVCWFESQDLMKDPKYETYTEKIDCEKGLDDFGPCAFWVPLCHK